MEFAIQIRLAPQTGFGIATFRLPLGISCDERFDEYWPFREVRDAHAAPGQPVTALTYLAGAKNTGNTREGIEKAVATAARKKD
jgi:hypothetical protein